MVVDSDAFKCSGRNIRRQDSSILSWAEGATGVAQVVYCRQNSHICTASDTCFIAFDPFRVGGPVDEQPPFSDSTRSASKQPLFCYSGNTLLEHAMQESRATGQADLAGEVMRSKPAVRGVAL